MWCATTTTGGYIPFGMLLWPTKKKGMTGNPHPIEIRDNKLWEKIDTLILENGGRICLQIGNKKYNNGYSYVIRVDEGMKERSTANVILSPTPHLEVSTALFLRLEKAPFEIAGEVTLEENKTNPEFANFMDDLILLRDKIQEVPFQAIRRLRDNSDLVGKTIFGTKFGASHSPDNVHGFLIYTELSKIILNEPRPGLHKLKCGAEDTDDRPILGEWWFIKDYDRSKAFVWRGSPLRGARIMLAREKEARYSLFAKEI
jgi:hypothetical protein